MWDPCRTHGCAWQIRRACARRLFNLGQDSYPQDLLGDRPLANTAQEEYEEEPASRLFVFVRPRPTSLLLRFLLLLLTLGYTVTLLAQIGEASRGSLRSVEGRRE